MVEVGKNGSEIESGKKLIKDVESVLQTGGERVKLLADTLKEEEKFKIVPRICSVVDDYFLDLTKKGEDQLVSFTKEVVRLSGKPPNMKLVEVYEPLIDQAIFDFNQADPELVEGILKGEGLDLKDITKEKIMLILLVQSNLNEGKEEGEKEAKRLSTLPKRENKKKGKKDTIERTKSIAKNTGRFEKTLNTKGVNHYIFAGTRFEKTFNTKGVNHYIFAGTTIVLQLLGVAGLLWGASTAIIKKGSAAEVWKSALENAPGWVQTTAEKVGIGLKKIDIEQGETRATVDRQTRYREYIDTFGIYNTLIDGDFPGVTAEGIVNQMDPVKANTNESWLRFMEFCGPKCWLEEATYFKNLRAVEEVMKLLGVDRAGYNYLKDHPENLSTQIASQYPDKPWLIDLFENNPTDMSSSEQSDYEKWREQYPIGVQKQLIIPLGMLGAPMLLSKKGFSRNQVGRYWDQQRRNKKGLGFGTSKGIKGKGF